MTSRSKIRMWNFLYADSRLRGAISYKMAHRNLESKDIEEATGLDRYDINHYLFRGKEPNLNNYEIIKLANFLGIEVELDLKFDDGRYGII